MRYIPISLFALSPILLVANIASAQPEVAPVNSIWSHVTPAQAAGVTLPKGRRIVDALRVGEVRAPLTSSYLLKVQPAAIVSLPGDSSQNYLALDCLRWVPTPRDEAKDVFVLYPELAERTYGGTFGRPREGKFASPFNPVVRTELVRLVSEMADKYPNVGGLVLRCELPWGAPLLGYSEAARADAINGFGVDPANIMLGGSTSPHKDDAETWIAWRLYRVNELVEELARQWKKRRPQSRVVVVGYAGWMALKNGKRNTMLSNWPVWAKSPNIDEVILEDKWRAADAKTTMLAISEAQRQGKTVSLMVSSDQMSDSAVAAATARALADYPKLGIVLESENSLTSAQLNRWNELIEAARSQTPIVSPVRSVPEAPATPLKIGAVAPNFAILDANGQSWNLAQWRGERNVLLTFFPKCFTGQCEQHLESLRAVRDELADASVEVVAVSTDDAATQQRFSNVLGLDFTLLPDTDRQISKLYDAIVGEQTLASRQSVLIDKAGVIRWIDKNVNVTRHGEDVLQQAKLLNLS